MFFSKKNFLFSISLFYLFSPLLSAEIETNRPKLGIVIIIDQFAHHYISKIKPYLTEGLKKFLYDGQVYENNYIPHAHPGTGPGHVTISTGTYPKNHGVISNYWINKNGKKENYERLDIDKKYAEFSPKGTYSHGISAQNIMTDNISDQFVLKSQPNKPYKVFTIAHKARAAVGAAGKLGKAIWFDSKGRQFTSSKAYFDSMPKWVKTFNSKYLVEEIPKALTWNLFHKNLTKPYNFFDINNYKNTNYQYTILNTPFSQLKMGKESEYDELYIKTPHANQHLLDLAKKCLDTNLKKEDHMLLWISLSPLDPLGHYYGPDSKETIDMLYHLDWQIGQFMEYVEKKMGREKVCFMLTADHGIMPIIENLRDRGMNNIHRINPNKLIKDLNNLIYKKYNINELITTYLNPQFYVDKYQFDVLPKELRRAISKTVKKHLESVPGIAEVWCYNKLTKLPVQKDSINDWFKNQLYPERSGQFICKTNPYCAITSHPRGTHHKTPYEYDTHVPLAIYQDGKYENKTFSKRVFSTQIAGSIAKIFGCNRPSASRCEPLPGI